MGERQDKNVTALAVIDHWRAALVEHGAPRTAREQAAWQIEQYRAAAAAGLFDRLAEIIKQHGQAADPCCLWEFTRESLQIRATYHLQNGALCVTCNRQVVLSDGDADGLVFTLGQQGRWLQAVEAEHQARMWAAELSEMQRARMAAERGAAELWADV